MRRVLLAIASLLALGLTACGDALHPVMLSGEDAQQLVDIEAGRMLAARHPGIAVGPARCPFLLNLTGGRREECTIPVAGKTMRVNVVRHEAGGGGLEIVSYAVRDVDALVVKSDAERRVASQLGERYGVPFTVRCDGPPVRVIPINEKFECRIDAPTIYADRDAVKAVDRDGDVVADSLPSGDTALVRFLGREIAERKNGGVDFPGERLERYLRATAGSPSQHEELVARRLIRSVRCPKRVVLGGLKRVTCAERLAGTEVKAGVRFDEGRGLVVEQPAVVVVKALQEISQRYYEDRMRAAHRKPTSRVHCDVSDESGAVQRAAREVAVVEPGDEVLCETVSGRWYVSTSFLAPDDNGAIEAHGSAWTPPN